MRVNNTILAGGAGGTAPGVADGGGNLSSDHSEGFTVDTSRSGLNPLLTLTLATIGSNAVTTTNFTFVTNVSYPATNFVPPVITNGFQTNTLVPPTPGTYFNLVIQSNPLRSYTFTM